MKKYTNIFEQSDCLSEEALTKYVFENLSAAEKHSVEIHLAGCEICSDAAEGLALVKNRKSVSAAVSELNQKINERITYETATKKPKIIFLSRYRMQLAAAASLLFIAGLVWFFRYSGTMKELDAVSSERIFAEKFSPPPPDEENDGSFPEKNRIENTVQHEPLPVLSEGQVIEEESVVSAGDRNAEDIRTNTGKAEYMVAQKTIMPDADIPELKKDKPQDEETKLIAKESLKKQESDKSAFFGSTEPYGEAPGKRGEYDMPASATSASGAVKSTETLADKKTIKQEKKTEEKQAQKDNTVETKNTNEGDDLLVRDRKSKRSKEKQSLQKSAGPAFTQSQQVVMAPPSEVQSQTYIAESGSRADTIRANLLLADTFSLIEAAMLKYNNQNYEGAASDFEETLKKNPEDEKALFYSAVSYLSLGQPDKAINNLNKIMHNKNSKYYDDAQWYISLAYIKKKDAQNARNNLMQLRSNSKSRYQKQAGETLNEMDKK